MRIRLLLLLVLLLVTALAQAQKSDAAWRGAGDASLHGRDNPALRRARDDFQRPIGELRELGMENFAGEWASFLAKLTHISEHAYFYTHSSDPAKYPLPGAGTLRWLGDQFDRVYPRALELWGITDPPHIEGDRRIVILVSSGYNKAGIYASRFSMPQEINPSFDEIGFVDVDFTHGPTLRSALNVLLHEFAHLLHHHMDVNRAGWVSEGLAVFQEIMLKSATLAGGPASYFLRDPRNQLNGWDMTKRASIGDYGKGALFFSYLYERFGLDFMRQFARHPLHGLDTVDALLADRGAGINADDVFTDWVIANYLLDSRRNNGRFGYPQLGSSWMRPARRHHLVSRLPATYDELTSRYAANYFELSPAALDESRPLLFRFNPAEPPQDAWLQLVQVLPNEIDVQRFTASQQNGNPIAANLHNNASRVFLAVSPFTPGDRRRMGPVFYSIDFSQRQADLTPSTSPATRAQSTTSQPAAAVVAAPTVTFSGQVHEAATDISALGRIYRASHDSGPALVVYEFVSAQAGELAFWVSQQEIDNAGVGCVKASADRRIAASKQANNNVVIAMGPDAENKTFHVVFDGGVSGGFSGVATTYDGPPGAGC